MVMVYTTRTDQIQAAGTGILLNAIWPHRFEDNRCVESRFMLRPCGCAAWTRETGGVGCGEAGKWSLDHLQRRRLAIRPRFAAVDAANATCGAQRHRELAVATVRGYGSGARWSLSRGSWHAKFFSRRVSFLGNQGGVGITISPFLNIYVQRNESLSGHESRMEDHNYRAIWLLLFFLADSGCRDKALLVPGSNTAKHAASAALRDTCTHCRPHQPFQSLFNPRQ
jgi:hypothetical protein